MFVFRTVYSRWMRICGVDGLAQYKLPCISYRTRNESGRIPSADDKDAGATTLQSDRNCIWCDLRMSADNAILLTSDCNSVPSRRRVGWHSHTTTSRAICVRYHVVGGTSNIDQHWWPVIKRAGSRRLMLFAHAHTERTEIDSPPTILNPIHACVYPDPQTTRTILCMLNDCPQWFKVSLRTKRLHYSTTAPVKRASVTLH